MILSNLRGTYDKQGIGYQPGISTRSLKNICLAKMKTNRTIFKFNYYGRNCYIDSYHFNKIYDLKWSHRFSYYIMNYLKSINKKNPKYIWSIKS